MRGESSSCAGGGGHPCRVPPSKRHGWLPPSFWVATDLFSVVANTGHGGPGESRTASLCMSHLRVPWLSVSFNRLRRVLATDPVRQRKLKIGPRFLISVWPMSQLGSLSDSSPTQRRLMFSCSCAALFQMKPYLGFPGVWRRVCVGGNTAKAIVQPHCLIGCEWRCQIFNITTEISIAWQSSWRETARMLTVHVILEGPGRAEGSDGGKKGDAAVPTGVQPTGQADARILSHAAPAPVLTSRPIPWVILYPTKSPA